MNYKIIFLIQIAIFIFSIGYLISIYKIDKENNLVQSFEYNEIYENNSKFRIVLFLIYMLIMFASIYYNTQLFTKLSETIKNSNLYNYIILPDYGIWGLISSFNSLYISYFFIDILLRLILRKNYRYKIGSFNVTNSSLFKILFSMVIILNILSFFLITDAAFWYAAFDKEKISIGENFSFKIMNFNYSDIDKISINKVKKNDSYSYYKLSIIFKNSYLWNSEPLRELNKTEISSILELFQKEDINYTVYE